jgi:predicted helicase
VVAVAGLEGLLAGLDPDEYRRGKQFERIVEWFLTHAPEYQAQLRRVWLWDDWPDRPSQDLGIDLMAEARSGDVWAIQAKAYAPDYSVTKRDLDSFLAASASRRFSYRLLVATTDRIAANARKTMEHQAIPVGMLLRSDLVASVLNWPVSPTRLVAPKAPKKKLRADQREAVRDVLAGFKTSDRGQMIRACGTGKTLAALGVHEQLDAGRTLVLVPSLSLLSQTLREWTANAKKPFEYLAVCSDETVAEADAAVASTHDLGVPVTTNENEIAAFLARRGPRVVFSTYQSSPQVAATYRKHNKPPALDLAISDEAHRCAGPVSSDFATILDATKITARRRLFMTATPRYFTGRIIREAKETDFEIASMDDKAVFGPVFHRLTFAQAIEQDLLSDYQVVIVGVDDATYQAWAEHGKYVTRDGTRVTDARTLASQIGLAKAIRKFDLRRVITFHSRVATARQFSNEMPDVIAWMPSRQRPTGRIHADYVSGKMSTGERRRRLSRLANPPPRERSLLSNARCLAEGVDVPTLDGVAFVDPRRSEIDIVQAVGRAIRLAPDKELGTIVVPVFIGSKGEADTVLNQSMFKPVWDVLKALRSHDDELAEQLDALRAERGRTGTSGRLPGKIVVDLPTAVGVTFAEHFSARLVDATTATWEYLFGKLEAFVRREGNAGVPPRHIEDDVQLGNWVTTQRVFHKNGLLSTSRAERLEALPGWSWEPRTERWEDTFEMLKAFVAREGDAQVPDGYVEGDVNLGDWVVTQRIFYKNGRLSASRTARLESIPGWSWDPIADQWEAMFVLLEAFVEREGHARVPVDHIEDDVPLGVGSILSEPVTGAGACRHRGPLAWRGSLDGRGGGRAHRSNGKMPSWH